jgi:hypothetical protein
MAELVRELERSVAHLLFLLQDQMLKQKLGAR